MILIKKNNRIEIHPETGLEALEIEEMYEKGFKIELEYDVLNIVDKLILSYVNE